MNFWNTYDEKKERKDFMKSNDVKLVDKLVKNEVDKYTLYMLLYPKLAQERLLKTKFIKTIKNIIRLPIDDIIYLLNETHIKSYRDIKKIILFLIIKLI
jgi:hypothetical protein